MKSLVYAAIAATILAAPIASFAQSNQQPLTRAQVKAELVQLEQNGYRPELNDPQYPHDLQVAQQRVSAEQQTLTRADTSGYGPQATGASQAGSRALVAPAADNSIYFGH